LDGEGELKLGTDGLGRGDAQASLRRLFEGDAECSVRATLWALTTQGRIQPVFVPQAMRDLGVEPDKAHPEIV
jgi:pyruvate dehydrogenase E1 component